jgi:hypothetical protein
MKADHVPVEKHLLAEPWASDPSKMTLDVPTYLKFRDARFHEVLRIAQRIVNPELP